jgi:hypothetical protein
MAGNKIVGPLSARFRGLGTVHVLGTKPVPGSLRAVAS